VSRVNPTTIRCIQHVVLTEKSVPRNAIPVNKVAAWPRAVQATSQQ
jgi:hypothetical protein